MLLLLPRVPWVVAPKIGNSQAPREAAAAAAVRSAQRRVRAVPAVAADGTRGEPREARCTRRAAEAAAQPDGATEGVLL